MLIPTQAAIEEKKVDEKGYVDQDWLKARLEKEPDSTTASSSGGAQSRSGYRVTTPLGPADYRGEIPSDVGLVNRGLGESSVYLVADAGQRVL